MGCARDPVCVHSRMWVHMDTTTRLAGPFTWLAAKVHEGWEMSLPLFITDAVCCCFLPFFFLEVSPKWYKVTRGKIRASLFHRWVIATDGHVHSAKTNSSSDKHNWVERGRRKVFASIPIHRWFWREHRGAVRAFQPPRRRGTWVPAREGKGGWGIS